MGGLAVLINAVGIVAFGAVSQTPAEAMEALLRTNTLVAMMLAGCALPVIRPGGSVVNISGVIAERNLPGMAAYGASKAALRAFDDALAREGRRVNVRVIDARPPHTETGMSARAIAGTPPSLGAGIPPARVARVICDGLEQGREDLPASAF
jgi:cyclic-di-GMP-binding biofilm dispersal mediator protein